MRILGVALWLGAIPAFSQLYPGPIINFLPPALDANGDTIAFGSTVTPSGTVKDTMDLYVGAVALATDVTSVALTSDGSRAVFTDRLAGAEGVGTVDTSTGVLQRVNVDTQGCIRPLALCVNCFFACVGTPHPNVDGSKVLFAVQQNQPFSIVNADGTNLVRLPVYSGTLAPAPQRVISASGLVVFTSSAPFGPTFAAAPTDVYLMNLDGSNIRNLTKFGSNPAIFAANATISADGNTVVFESNYAGAATPPIKGTQVWAVQADGSGLRQLTSGPGAATNPSISADGQVVVFVQSGQVNVLRPPAAPVAITSFGYSTPQTPVVSDDGLKIAFLVGPKDSSSAGAVYEINSDGTNLQAVYAPRAISPRGVVSAAGQGLAPSPGGLVTAYGINFTSDTVASAGEFPLPRVVSGASLLMAGTPLAMLSVSPWQINAQLPQQTPAQNTGFQASFTDGTVTPSESTDIVAAAPDLFVTEIARGEKTVLQAAAFHAGSATLADDDHPAQAGELLEMYGTGLGATDPPVPTGQPSPADPAATATLTPVVLVGDAQAEVRFTGLTPGLAGVYQVNILVPGGLSPGRYPITLKGTNGSQGGLGTLVVQ